MSNFAYMDMPLQIGFQYAGPLDKYVQFDSTSAANTWLSGALAYEGALVRIKDTTTGVWDVKVVQKVNNELTFSSLTPKSGTSAGDYVVVGDNGKIADSIISTITASTGASDSGKIVAANASGKVDESFLTIATTSSAANGLVKTGANGKIDSAFIPTIAIGEDFGRYDDWTAAEAALAAMTPARTPEHGDTIAIKDAGSDPATYTIYFCSNPSESTLADKFIVLKPSSGAVSEAEFTTHRTNGNAEKHVTAEQITAWNAKVDASDFVEGSNIDISVDSSTGAITIANTYSYTLPAATTTTLGGVIVGGGLQVDANGTLSTTITAASLGVYTTAEADEAFVAKVEGKGLSTNDFTDTHKAAVEALSTDLGGKADKVSGATNGNIAGLDANGNLTDSGKAVGGSTLNANPSANTLATEAAVSDAISNKLTASNIIEGTNISLTKSGNDVTINNTYTYTLPAATASTLGGIKVGSGLSVANDGTLSANILWTPQNFPAANEFTAGTNTGDNKYYVFDGVREIKIIDENGALVFPSDIKIDMTLKKTRIEFPSDFPANNEQIGSWKVLLGPTIA